MSRILALLSVAFILLEGCSPQDATQPTNAAIRQSAQRPAPSAPSLSRVPEFDPGDFVRVVDNPFFPLRPGTRFEYAGSEDGEPLKDLFDVTHDVKIVLGVNATVVLD